MRLRGVLVVVVLITWLLGCGSHDESTSPSAACPDGTVAKTGGGCTDPCTTGFAYDAARGSCAPILPVGECAAGTMPMIGKKECQAVGVIACGKGFVSDGTGGCNAILPEKACGRGKMAVPGETECRDVAPCGSGTWGDIAVEPSTLYVDGAYTGGGSDGSKSKPFTVIQQAIDAASATTNPIIAVASGTYTENLGIGKRLRLWGRCPSMVEVRSANASFPTIELGTIGDVTIRGVAVTGPWMGIGASSGTPRLEQVWVHDVGGIGIVIQEKKTNMVIHASLIERATTDGILNVGATATVDATVVRETRPQASDKLFGIGVYASASTTTKQPAQLVVVGSLMERNSQIGILVSGSTATIEATVVRDTLPQASDDEFGEGIEAAVSTVTKLGSEIVVRQSIIERNLGTGIAVSGSTATVESTVVRDTLPQASDKAFGRGIGAEVDRGTKLPSQVVVRNSLVERNMEIGISVFGGKATVESTIVRDMQPQASDHIGGLGISANDDALTHFPSELSVRGSLVERCYEVGIASTSSVSTIETTLVRDTRARVADGKFGDGIVAYTGLEATDPRGSITLTSSLSLHNARTGLSVFGADLTFVGSVLSCNLGGDLDQEQLLGPPPIDAVINDGGGNLCGCEGPLAACVPQTASIEAPPAPSEH